MSSDAIIRQNAPAARESPMRGDDWGGGTYRAPKSEQPLRSVGLTESGECQEEAKELGVQVPGAAPTHQPVAKHNEKAAEDIFSPHSQQPVEKTVVSLKAAAYAMEKAALEQANNGKPYAGSWALTERMAKACAEAWGLTWK